jgi:hypothetical protein
VRPSTDDADQQGGDQACHEQGDRAAQLVAPGATHIPGEQERRAHREDEFDACLQCHVDFLEGLPPNLHPGPSA